jgi:hypothetical protein
MVAVMLANAQVGSGSDVQPWVVVPVITAVSPKLSVGNGTADTL